MFFFSFLFVFFCFSCIGILVEGTTLHCLEHALTRKLNHLCETSEFFPFLAACLAIAKTVFTTNGVRSGILTSLRELAVEEDNWKL